MALRDGDIQDPQLRDNLQGIDIRIGDVQAAARKRLTALEGRGTSGNNTRAAASSTLLTTGYVTYLTVTVTTTGRPALLDYYFVYSNDNSGANRTISVKAQLDGVDVGQNRTLDAALVAGTSNRITASGSHLLTSLAAGSHTFTVQILASAGSSVSIKEGELTVLET